jgi:hypothetical protein
LRSSIRIGSLVIGVNPHVIRCAEEDEMRVRALSVTVVVLCLTIGASACGGDDSGGSTDASAAVIAQIDEICADWKDALDERGDFPVEDFDPESPAPEDLPPVGNYFASGEAAADDAIAEIRGLSPPADFAAEVDALVAAFERQLNSAKAQAVAARASDVAAFTATLEDASSSLQAVKEAADDLGTEGCVL